MEIHINCPFCEKPMKAKETNTSKLALTCKKCDVTVEIGFDEHKTTNLDKWKQEKIKEIENMTIEHVRYELEGKFDRCKYCGYDPKACHVKCEEGIKVYLESEVKE